MFAILAFSGCGQKIVYIDKPVEVKVPVKCKVPNVKCSFKAKTYTGIISKLVECIEKKNAAIKVCQ